MKTLICSAALLALLAGPSLAQPAPTGGNCLFPLACPGPVPPKPEPLLGTPEEQAAPAEPAPMPRKAKHHVHKVAAKKKS